MFAKIKQKLFWKNDRRGTGVLMFIMVFGSIATVIIVSGISSYALFEHRASTRKHDRDLALHIAEAGANYYRWHLAHAPEDYTDGTGVTPGPYVHDYTDKDGNVIGQYSLEIDEPLPGSTVVTVRSTGWTAWNPSVQRTIQIRIGFPSLADYATLSKASMNFSFTTEVHGQVHSNGGIRFDGTTDSWVTSAKETYTYENQTHDGVWGGGGPKSFWKFPVPEVDFDAISADLADLRDDADENGIHLNSSGEEGWHIVFDGDSFDLYKVMTKDCYYGEGRWRNRGWSGWYWDGNIYCYDIGTEEYVSTNDIPTNGALFVEDNVWVDGTLDGRVTIAVGRFPVQEPYEDIIISGNVLYTEKGSGDVLGLITQGDVLVPYEVPETMEINAAALAQYGKVYRPYYYEDMKTSLTFFGSQISYDGGGWKYVNGWGNVISGFEDTFHVYDGNLKYSPPPGFPVEPTYELISWEELE